MVTNTQKKQIVILMATGLNDILSWQSKYKNLGRLMIPGWCSEPEETTKIMWGADNGAFSGFKEDKYLRMLERLSNKNCKFVTAPDVVGNAEETLKLFHKWKSVIKKHNLPIALVGQDGLENLEIPWNEFQGFFIGGSTEWKLSEQVRRLINIAKHKNKWVHMGRVNSVRRIRYAMEIGCDSIDGTAYSKFFKSELPRVIDYFKLEQGKLFV
jgi:hypothetical protein